VSQKRDYYVVLGLGRNASSQEIKSAYRKLALQFHPDRNPDKTDESTEKFKEITEAYSVLADPEKRAAYDRFGHAGVGGAPDFSSTIFSGFEDIFGDLFGFGDIFGQRRGGRSRTERGADLRYDMEISFEEAATGLNAKIKIPRWETCAECLGRGAQKGSEPVPCRTCNGRGQVRSQRGFFTLTRTCPDCRGAGQVIVDPCMACNGEGRVLREKVLGVPIPAGVDDGARLRLSGEGEAGYFGGPPGDLYVVLRVREHSFFERRGSDLYCSIPISVTQAVLGAEIKVPTLKGEERLPIPEGTQPGSVFRVRGKGFPNLDRGGQGDLYVNVEVVIPSHLTREQRRLFEMLSGTTRVENKPLLRHISDKVKNIFG
jgi:molecular chaperone DnaJ